MSKLIGAPAVRGPYILFVLHAYVVVPFARRTIVTNCPVCDYEIKDPIAIKTPRGETIVCCDECAEKVKEAPGQFAPAHIVRER